MAIKKKSQKELTEENVDLNEDGLTPAAQTIQAKPSAASKAGMMADVMSAMSQMPSDECCKWFEDAMAIANSKYYSKDIPDGAAESNKASVAAKSAVKEDVDGLFEGQELSEEFKEKTAVLFEAAVNARVLAETEKLEEQYQEKLQEEVAEITENLTDQVDQYLSYVAEQWMEQNEVAIETALRNQLSEDFMNGLRDLFAEHYISFPEESVDAVEALSERVEELEARLTEALNENIEMKELKEAVMREEIFNEVTEGMAMTQVEKLKTLAEGIDYDDEETFKRKLSVLKEHHFHVKPTQSLLNEEVDVEEETEKPAVFAEPQIRSYADAISRTIKR